MTCFVPWCKMARRKLPPESDISFHRVPTESKFREYLDILGLEAISWNKNVRICSLHFHPNDVIKIPTGRFLRPDAVPSVRLESTCTGPTPTKQLRLNENIVALQNLPSPSTNSEEMGCCSRAFEDISEPGASNLLLDTFSEGRQQSKASTIFERRSSNTTIGRSSSDSIRESISSGSTSSGTRKRKAIFIKRIHNYSRSPTTITTKNVNLKPSLRKTKLNLSRKKKTIVKLRQQILSLQNVQKLQRSNLISTSAVEYLEKSLDGVPKELVGRYLKNCRHHTTTREQYPPNLRRFAMTLHFFSNKAYEYVRKEFKLNLPHQSTIRKWCTAIDCKPGFQRECFKVLEQITKKMKEKGHMNLCSLLFDEISIKKKIDINGFGYVNLGIEDDSDDLEPASEALVFMVLNYTGNWKLPIAYFFIKSLTGNEKGNLVKEALIRLDEVGVHIASIICDGPNSHFTMFKELGCDWSDLNNIKSYFVHPTNGKKVFAIFDVCHMIKLLRNHFSNLGTIYSEGNKIS